MILIIPLPQMLQPTTMAMAMRAMAQLVRQLEMAVELRVRPIQMMMGPVTMGGK